MALYTTYDSVGIREDLTDDIWDVSQDMTPITSAIRKVTSKARQHDWQTDILAAAVDTNAAIEGATFSSKTVTPTVRLNNHTQISTKVLSISKTDRKADNAGRGDELDYQIMREKIVLKTDIEKSYAANKAKVAGNNSTARVAGGLESWIASNTSVGATGADPTGDGTDTRTDGTLRAFTELLLKPVLASIADAGGKADRIMLGSFNKQEMSAFAGNAPRRTDGTDKKLMNTIDIYDSDFGDIQTQYSPFSRPESALILDTSLLALAMHRDMVVEDLAKTSDSDERAIVTEWTAEVRNEKGLGGVFDLLLS